MDSKSFLYDAGKVTDIKSPEIELNRKTRLHTLGTDVASDTDFFSNESYPDLEISPKEMPMAFIDESYPGVCRRKCRNRAERDASLLRADLADDAKQQAEVVRAGVAVRQPGAGHRLL